jgi:hypothetical protein
VNSRRASVVVPLVGAVLTSCGGGIGPGTTPATTSVAPPSVRPFVGDGTSLEPGRYRYDAFEPAMTFAVGPGWVGGHVHAEFFDVQREEGVLLGFARPTFVMGRDGAVDSGRLGALDALRAIASIRGVDTDPVATTAIDGRRAFEIRTRSAGAVELFGGDEGTFTAEAGRHRVIALEVEGVLVLVIQHIWADDPASLEPLVQAVIDSVRFQAKTTVFPSTG